MSSVVIQAAHDDRYNNRGAPKLARCSALAAQIECSQYLRTMASLEAEDAADTLEPLKPSNLIHDVIR